MSAQAKHPAPQPPPSPFRGGSSPQRRGEVRPPPYHRPDGWHFPAPSPIPAPRRILVVKLFALGDMLNVTPALRALRQRYPAARIDVLATRQGAPALARSPYVDEVLTFEKALFDQVGSSLSPRALLAGLRFALDLRRRRYDTLVLLHHLITTWGTVKYTALALWSGARVRAGLDNGRGWFLTHRARDEGFGTVSERAYWLRVTAAIDAPSDDDRPAFTVTAADRLAATRLLAPHWTPGRGPLVAIHAPHWTPGRGPLVAIHATNGPYAPGRQWPAERFAAVADRLTREHGATIALVGVAREAEGIARVAAAMDSPAINLAGRTDLPTLAGVLTHAALLLGNDSSVGHLAAALGTPTLILFGPSNERAWLPWGAGRIVLPPAGQPPPPLPTNRALAVRSAAPQAPCLYVGCGPGNPHGCPNCHCLDLIAAEQVAAIAVQMLARPAEATARGLRARS